MWGRSNLSEFEYIVNTGHEGTAKTRVRSLLPCVCLCVSMCRGGVPLWCCHSSVAGHKPVAGTSLVQGKEKWPLQPVGSPWLMAPLAFLLLFGRGEQLGGSGEWPKAAAG